MLNSIRLSFVSLGFAFLALFLVSVSVAQAATCTATTGDWDEPGTWSNCNDDIPTADDDVVIPTGVIVTVDVAGAVANTLTIQAAAVTNGVMITSPGTLVVSGSATIAAATETANSFINVGSVGASFTAGSLSITGSDTVDENSVLIVDTGTVTITGNVTFAGTAAQAQFTSTNASNINIGGHFGSGGTFARGNSTVTFDGDGAQNVGAYSYHNVTIDKSAGTATLLGNTLILNQLLVSSGTFSTSTHDIDVTGTTTISDGGTLTHGTGEKVHNGALVIDEGGTWTETGAAAVDFLGHVTNNGTFTAGAGLHRFLNFTRTINGTFSIPSVSFIGDAVYTNNGTLTIGTSLGGNGTLINGADATLNIGDEVIDDAEDGLTFTASAVGNTVNYNRAGAQTVKIPTGGAYGNLTFSGGGTKSVGSALTIAGDLSIDSGVKASLTGESTANQLFLGEELKYPGVWGSSSSNAENRNNTYFSGTGTVTVTVGAERRPSSSGGMASPALLAQLGITPNNQTIEQLLAQVKQLQELLAKLQGQTTQIPGERPACVSFLRLGSKGEEVKILQAKLGILADGIFGKDTEKALRNFQSQKGLMSDGIAGPESCSNL